MGQTAKMGPVKNLLFCSEVGIYKRKQESDQEINSHLRVQGVSDIVFYWSDGNCKKSDNFMPTIKFACRQAF